MTYETSTTDAVAPTDQGAWALPALGSAVLAVIWGAYTLVLFYEIAVVSRG